MYLQHLVNVYNFNANTLIVAHQVTYDKNEAITIVRYHGSVTMTDVVEGAAEGAQFAANHGCSKILIDARHMDSGLTAANLFFLPRELAKKLSSLGLSLHSYKRALLIDEKVNDLSFVEVTSRNVGHNTRVFFEEDMAMQWLSA